jgi:MFS family permease
MDFWLLFVTRAVRMFSYGAITIIFMVSLLSRFNQHQVNILLTGILAGDLVMSLYLTTRADKVIGRRRVLMIGAVLKAFAGIVFAMFDNYYVLLVAGIVGVVSPTGGDVGPFLSVEQAALTQLVGHRVAKAGTSASAAITDIMARYQLLGAVFLALGSFTAGWLIRFVNQLNGINGTGAQAANDYSTAGDAYRLVYIIYTSMALVNLVIYFFLSPEIEVEVPKVQEVTTHSKTTGLRPESRLTVAKLCALFSVDSFAGGLVLQSYIAWWFMTKWALTPEVLGITFLVLNIVAGVSGLAAGWFVRKIGAINTMVFTHLPSNILLMLIVVMPTRETAVAMLWARYSISQMDVPARQAYVAVVVDPSERSAAGGWTGSARSVGVALAPLLLSALGSEEAPINSWAFASPFVISGILKILYDVTVYISFYTSRKVGSHGAEQKATSPKEEQAPPSVEVSSPEKSSPQSKA